MKVLVVVCLIASVSALPRSFLGSEKCTWGPAYWCKTYKQATECNAIEHCKTHVWKSNDICSECKTVAGQLHDYCKNNASAVMKLMKNLCAELEQYATECKTVVALYGETIINMVVQLTADSEKFCQGLELCPKTKQDVTHWIMKVFLKQLVSNPTIMNVKSLKEDYCEDCKLVIGEIKDVLMNKEIQSDIIAALESLCTELGPFGAECKNLVDQYGPLVFDLLAGYMDPGTICSDLGLCNSSKNIVPAVPLKLAAVPLKPAPVKTLLSAAPIPVLILAKEVKKAKPAKSPKASLQCTLCEFVMKELDGLLKDQETEDGIEQALDKVCSLLPPTIQSDCEDFVKEFSPEIIDFLVNELQPDKVCAALGLCNGKKNLIRVSLHKDVKVKDETCELCKLAVQYLENVLKTNATEEEIKKALEQLCSSLPPQLSTECNQIVQEYGDLIIKLILGDITPEEVCQALNLCTAVKKSYVKNKCYLGESYWCANYFNALKCENEIFQEIMRVCSHLPSSLSSKCFLAAREFRKDKENEIEDRSLCEVLKFFKNAESQVVSKKGVKNSSVCDDCKYGVKFIGNLFPKNTTKKEILDGLKAVCSRFQPVVSKVCNDLVNRYSELIVKLLLGEVDPEKFCEQLKLCKPSKKARTNWKCYLGESFWCSSYQNALDCQALEHCKINV